MDNWTHLADDATVQKTVGALKANGFEAVVVNSSQEAKEKVISMLPQGAEVMNMTSVTLDTIGVSDEIMESGKYDAVKKKLMSMDRATQGREMQKLGTAPEYAVGSVHAVTQDGVVMVASNTGSQLPAYIYGSAHVIWVVGTQKIVKDMDSALKRLHEHTFQLESERAHKAYGVPSTSINKLTFFYKEPVAGRTTIIFVKEVLGF